MDLKTSYTRWTEASREKFGAERGAELAIGAEFHAFGIIELEMLRHYGLTDEKYLIDVGCGSGRLSQPLAQMHQGRYLGIDVVEELVEHARSLAKRPDWRFETVDRISIPESDGAADMVCMFSILTHLLHEQSYIYLEEAKRVLRPGGLIVVSFLEFAMAFHWNVFIDTVQNHRFQQEAPLNMFIERIAFDRWAEHLGLEIREFRNGDDPFVPLPRPVRLEDGRLMKDLGNLGQSICVLRKS